MEEYTLFTKNTSRLYFYKSSSGFFIAYNSLFLIFEIEIDKQLYNALKKFAKNKANENAQS